MLSGVDRLREKFNSYSPYDEQAHGNGEQRVSAIMGGYNDGFLACNLLI